MFSKPATRCSKWNGCICNNCQY